MTTSSFCNRRSTRSAAAISAMSATCCALASISAPIWTPANGISMPATRARTPPSGAALSSSSNNPDADANGNITVEKGDHIPGIPQNLFKFGADDHVTPRWTVGFTANAETSTFLYGDEANLTKPLPGYFTADINTSYQITPRLQIFASVENVTDTKYYEFGTRSRRPGWAGACMSRRRRITPIRAATASRRRLAASAA